MTVAILGIDGSEFQEGEPPWALCQFAIIRATIGYRMDVRFAQHYKALTAAGKPFAFYHALLKHNPEDASDTHPPVTYDPVRQAAALLAIIGDDDLSPIRIVDPVTGQVILVPRVWVDVEALGIDAPLLAAFLAEFRRQRPGVPIGIYSSALFWKMLIGLGHTEFAGCPLWCAEYPNATLALAFGQAPWPPALPDLPDLWPRPLIWQFRYKRGYWPGYPPTLDLDTNVLIPPLETPVPTPTLTIPETPRGSKLAVSVVGAAAGKEFAQAAHDAGAPLAGAFGMDNGGFAMDCQPLVAITVTRIVQGATDAPGGILDGDVTDEQLTNIAASQAAAYTHLSAAEQAGATYKAFLCEPRPETIHGYLNLTRLQMIAAGVYEAHGWRMLAYAFNAGTPEPDEALAMWRYEYHAERASAPAERINARLLCGGHGIAFHAGAIGRPGKTDVQADTFDDSILGVTLVNPNTGYSVHLDNCDDVILRHRMLKWAADEVGVALAPLFGLEFYPVLGPLASYPLSEIVRRYAQLDTWLAEDPYVVFVAPYSNGSTGVGLPRNDHTAVWRSGLVPHVIAVKDRVNKTRKDDLMAFTTKAQQTLHDTLTVLIAGAQGALAQVDAIVPDDAPPAASNWWERLPAGVFTAPVAYPVQPKAYGIFNQSGGSLGFTRTNSGSIFERQGDLLRVLSAPINGQIWWVRAEELTAPPAV